MKPRVPAYTREYEKEFFEKFYEERKRILDMGMAGHDMSDAFDSVRPKENGSAFETKFEVITNMGGKSWEEISHEQQKFFIITSKGRGYANKVVDEFLSTTSNVSEKKEIIRLRKKVEEDKWGFVVYNQKLGVYYSKSFHSRATTMDSDDFLQESMFSLEKAVSDFDKANAGASTIVLVTARVPDFSSQSSLVNGSNQAGTPFGVNLNLFG